MDRYHAVAAGVDLVWQWDSIEALKHRVENSAVPVLLIEDAGGGDIAVGPLFQRGRAGCLACYMSRRIAAGATEIRPPTGQWPRGRLDLAIAAVIDAERAGEVPMQQLVAADGSWSVHRLLPLPHCSCHRSALGVPALAQLPLMSAVDERLGIVRRIEVEYDRWDGYVSARAHGAAYKTLAGDPVFNHGYAADTSIERAKARAVGEALERYAAAMGGPAPRQCAPGDVLSGPWPEQARMGSKQLRWMSGHLLSTRRPVAVPARRVRLPYRPEPDEPPLFDVTSSTGLAAAPDMAGAEAHGLLETIERDVFMRAWRLRPDMERLSQEPGDPPGLQLVRLRHPGLVPVVVAFLEDERPPFVAAGLAARLTLLGAREAALREAVAARIWVEDWISKDPTVPPDPPHSLYEHAKLHALDPRLRAARARWLAHATPRAKGLPSAVDTTALRDAEPNAISVDLTTLDLSLVGCRAARVIAPGRVMLDSDGRRPCIEGWPTPHPFA